MNKEIKNRIDSMTKEELFSMLENMLPLIRERMLSVHDKLIKLREEAKTQKEKPSKKALQLGVHNIRWTADELNDRLSKSEQSRLVRESAQIKDTLLQIICEAYSLYITAVFGKSYIVTLEKYPEISSVLSDLETDFSKLDDINADVDFEKGVLSTIVCSILNNRMLTYFHNHAGIKVINRPNEWYDDGYNIHFTFHTPIKGTISEVKRTITSRSIDVCSFANNYIKTFFPDAWGMQYKKYKYEIIGDKIKFYVVISDSKKSVEFYDKLNMLKEQIVPVNILDIESVDKKSLEESMGYIDIGSYLVFDQKTSSYSIVKLDVESGDMMYVLDKYSEVFVNKFLILYYDIQRNNLSPDYFEKVKRVVLPFSTREQISLNKTGYESVFNTMLDNLYNNLHEINYLIIIGDRKSVFTSTVRVNTSKIDDSTYENAEDDVSVDNIRNVDRVNMEINTISDNKVVSKWISKYKNHLLYLFDFHLKDVSDKKVSINKMILQNSTIMAEYHIS